MSKLIYTITILKNKTQKHQFAWLNIKWSIVHSAEICEICPYFNPTWEPYEVLISPSPYKPHHFYFISYIILFKKALICLCLTWVNFLSKTSFIELWPPWPPPPPHPTVLDMVHFTNFRHSLPTWEPQILLKYFNCSTWLVLPWSRYWPM